MRCKTCEFDPCRCEDLEEGFRIGTKYGKAGWPMWSDSLGCEPSQIAAEQAFFRKHGETVEHNPHTGQVKLNSERQKNRLAKLKGHVDTSHGNAHYYKVRSESGPPDLARDRQEQTERLAQEIEQPRERERFCDALRRAGYPG